MLLAQMDQTALATWAGIAITIVMSFVPSALWISTTLRSPHESASMNVYVPAGNTCPATSTGWLKVSTVFLSGGVWAALTETNPSNERANPIQSVFLNITSSFKKRFAEMSWSVRYPHPLGRVCPEVDKPRRMPGLVLGTNVWVGADSTRASYRLCRSCCCLR